MAAASPPADRWRLRASAVRVTLQWGAALLVLAAGAIHLWLWFDFFRTVHVVGTLFLLNFATAVVVGFALLLRAAPLLVIAGIAYSVGTLGAFSLSVTVGLFGYVESLRGPWQETAGAIELASIVLLAPLLGIILRSRATSTPRYKH